MRKHKYGRCTVSLVSFQSDTGDGELLSLLMLVVASHRSEGAFLLKPMYANLVFLRFGVCRRLGVVINTNRVVAVAHNLFLLARWRKVVTRVLISAFFFQKFANIAVLEPGYASKVLLCFLYSLMSKVLALNFNLLRCLSPRTLILNRDWCGLNFGLLPLLFFGKALWKKILLLLLVLRVDSLFGILL